MIEIEELEKRGFASPALSLYLTLGGDEEAPKRYLGPLLQELSTASSDADERKLEDALHGEIRTAERELAGRTARGGIAVFSCRPEGVLEVFELPEAVPPMMVFGDHLETWPLRVQLERHPGEVVRARRARR